MIKRDGNFIKSYKSSGLDLGHCRPNQSLSTRESSKIFVSWICLFLTRFDFAFRFWASSYEFGSSDDTLIDLFSNCFRCCICCRDNLVLLCWNAITKWLYCTVLLCKLNLWPFCCSHEILPRHYPSSVNILRSCHVLRLCQSFQREKCTYKLQRLGKIKHTQIVIKRKLMFLILFTIMRFFFLGRVKQRSSLSSNFSFLHLCPPPE